MAVSILINGNPGPATAAAYGDEFTFANNDNTGVVSWQWTIADKPAGSAATLTTPTGATCKLTVDVEGTYLVRLTVNADAQQTNTAAVVFPARIASKSPNAGGANLRYPAATENDEVQAGRGWAEDLNKWLELANKDQILPRKVAVYTSSVFKGPARVTGDLHTIDAAGTLSIVLAANAGATQSMPCTVFFDEDTTANGVSYGILFGPVNTTADLRAGSIGDPVYINDAGNVSLVPGTIAQIIGYVIKPLNPGRIMFYPQNPTLYHGVAPGGTTHPEATEGTAGFMSANDKIKLNLLPDAYAIPTGSNIAPLRIRDFSQAGVTDQYSRADHTHDHGPQTQPSHHALATQSAHGFMSSTDKKKLDGVVVIGSAPTILANIVSKTIYARVAGNDTTGDGTLSKPYRTFIRAIKDVPLDIVNTIYTIDITGIGTEVISADTSYTLPAFRSNLETSIYISPIRIHADTTVVDSFNGATVSQVSDDIYGVVTVVTVNGRTWTPDEHAGRLIGQVVYPGSPSSVIISNTADTLHIISTGGTVDSTYGILSRSAELVVNNGFYINNTAGISIRNIKLTVGSINIANCGHVALDGVYYNAVNGCQIDNSRVEIYRSWLSKTIVDSSAYAWLSGSVCNTVQCGYYATAYIKGSRCVLGDTTIYQALFDVSDSRIKSANIYGDASIVSSVVGLAGSACNFSITQQSNVTIWDVDTAGDINFNVANGSMLMLGIYPNANNINLVADEQVSTWAEFDDASSPWYHMIQGRYGSKIWSGY